METFTLKIWDHKGRRPGLFRYRSLWLMYRELQEYPDTQVGPKTIIVLENFGIRNKNISASTKQLFKQDIQDIAIMYPDMPKMFTGHISFVEKGTVLQEVRFTPKKR